jgi:hypothetical protein
MSPRDIDSLSFFELKMLVVQVLGEVSALKQTVAEQRDEIARLKGQKGRPDIKPPIKPSGMDKASQPEAPKGRRRGGGNKTAKRVIHEERIIKALVPPGSRFKGYESFVVQDLVLRPHVIRFRRERWLTPDGETIIAPLPGGVRGHFGAELRRFVLVQHHQGQVTVARLVTQLRAIGIDVSKRQVMRMLIGGQEQFVAEARDVLRAGLATATWISVDDTGARHKGTNGFCTQIGNDHFAWFGTTGSKSRLNFLELLRAGYSDYMINDEALAYMRGRSLSGPVIAQLAAQADLHFADAKAWIEHLERLGITDLKVTPDPICIATEGALWGSVVAHGFLRDSVIVSDDAGQFDVGLHALCWIHAERLVHKLETFTEHNRMAQKELRGLIWEFYRDLLAYRADPSPQRKAALRARFDRIFKRTTGFVSLDRLLKRLRANKPELLRVLDRPMIPLHTNGSENDIRCQVTKRKISGGTRSDQGRDCRDAFLGLAKTCAKLGIAFWDYLGARLEVANQPAVLRLPELVTQRAMTVNSS